MLKCLTEVLKKLLADLKLTRELSDNLKLVITGTTRDMNRDSICQLISLLLTTIMTFLSLSGTGSIQAYLGWSF